MTTTTPSLVRRTFRIIVDIETTVTTSPRERLGDGKTHERSYQAPVQHLLAHPPALRHLNIPAPSIQKHDFSVFVHVSSYTSATPFAAEEEISVVARDEYANNSFITLASDQVSKHDDSA